MTLFRKIATGVVSEQSALQRNWEWKLGSAVPAGKLCGLLAGSWSRGAALTEQASVSWSAVGLRLLLEAGGVAATL